MSTPFARSIRSLKADNRTFTNVGAAIMMLLILAWLAWFGLAQIRFYETGEVRKITAQGIIVANFSPGSMERIQAGQEAFFYAYNGGQPRPIPAVVVDVTPAEGRVRLLLQVEAAAFGTIFQNGAAGQVEVVVEQVSPAVLVMHTAGLLPVEVSS